MDIKEEIRRIQEQLDVLKKKQEESNECTLKNGQLYLKGNSDYFLALISQTVLNQKQVWSYSFSDGSGESFNTKEELADYLVADGFRYYGKLKSFTKE